MKVQGKFKVGYILMTIFRQKTKDIISHNHVIKNKTISINNTEYVISFLQYGDVY